MRVLNFTLRVLLLMVLFLGIGAWAAHALISRAVAHGKREYEVRLGAYMGGLFIGGSAATAAGVLMLLSGKRSPASSSDLSGHDDVSS